MLLNSRLAYDDPEPWVVHYGQGWPEERFSVEVAGADWKPRTRPARFPNTLLAKFRHAVPYNLPGILTLAQTWLDYFEENAGDFAEGRLRDEMVHARKVLRRLMNVYGEA